MMVMGGGDEIHAYLYVWKSDAEDVFFSRILQAL